jgi:hypothetical protein
MPRVGFEPTIPVVERAKIFHALDTAAIVTDTNNTYHHMAEYFSYYLPLFGTQHIRRTTRNMYPVHSSAVVLITLYLFV